MTTRKKSGKQYRYYVINRKFNSGACVCNVPNQPAELPEQAVVDQVLSFMRNGAMVSEYWTQIQELNPGVSEMQVVVTLLQRTAEIWDTYFPHIQHLIIRSLIERVTIEDGGVRINWRCDEWPALLESMVPDTVGVELDEMELA